MLSLVDDAIEAYAAAHTSPVSDLHDRLRAETLARTTVPQMQVGPVEGRLLMLLARIASARFAVEVGTFTGGSALHIAEGVTDDGKLVTCDIDPVNTAIARRAWSESPFGHKIELRLGPAAETLARIDGPIDFAFIDADKPGYIAYWDALVPKLRPGGVIVADNVLWSGRVLDPQDESSRAIVAFNSHVNADPRVDHVMLTVRDGITIARKR